jgi:hypothetical protein
VSELQTLPARTSPAADGNGHASAKPALAARRAARRRQIALLLLYAWAVYSLVQGGSLILREPYMQVLATAPRAAQGGVGDGYAQTLIKLERSLPYDQRVLLVWRRPEKGVVGFWYGYFWATYWLYPRQVDIVTDRAAAPATAYGIVLDVRSADQSQPDAAAGYFIDSTSTYPDQVITVLRAAGD